jgi:predicted nucleic acid-binding Zn ribbon protein
MIRSNRMRPLNQALPGALASLLRAAPLSAGKVGFAWRTAVGSAMDRVTSVRLEGRVLFVDATSPQWAREVARSSGIILARLQTLLGDNAVERIEVK